MNDLTFKLGILGKLAKFPLDEGLQPSNTIVSEMSTLMKTRSGFDSSRTPINLNVAGKTPLLRKMPSASRQSFHSGSFNMRREKSNRSQPRWLPLHSAAIDRLAKTPTELLPRASSKSLNLLWQKYLPKAGKPPTYLSLYNLLHGLPEEGLTRRDIKRRFGISKSSVESLIAKGLLGEHWGSEGFGVKYRLTDEGRTRLKGIREASRLVSKKDAFTSLKTRFPM